MKIKEQMLNSLLKFPSIISNNKEYKDFSKLCEIPKIPDYFYEDKYKDYIILEDNRLLESISFELYNNTNYWDVLGFYNKMISLDELPVDNDIVLERISKRYNEYIQNNKKIINYKDTNNTNILDNITKEEQEKNEKYRKFYYIKPEYINELLIYIKNNSKKYNSDVFIDIAVYTKDDK